MNILATIPQLRDLAEAGDPYAQFELGVAYEEGHDVDKNFALSGSWYEKAAEQGHQAARHNLVLQRIYPNDSGPPTPPMIESLKVRAEAGDIDAQVNYGLCFFFGRGVLLDFDQARFWYEKAALAGDSTAQFNFGGLYFEGNGVEIDFVQAIGWYTRAAEQGHELALLHLGSLHEKGTAGLAQNFSRARALYLIAYRRGSMRAAIHLGFMYAKARGVSRDAEQAYQLFEQATELPDRPDSPPNMTYLRSAYYQLGALTEELKPRARKRAIDWYQRGETIGCDSCKLAVDRVTGLLKRPSGTTKDKRSTVGRIVQ